MAVIPIIAKVMPTDAVEELNDSSAEPFIRGFLHTSAAPNGNGLVLTHSAGGNCRAKLLVAIAGAFAAAGFLVLRCDLPFRQKRPKGPPHPSGAAQDRQGLRRAILAMKGKITGRALLGGHSYGGRQASMLAAEAPELVAGLLLLSYPLHPPRDASNLRVNHFPKLITPALFVHGSHDPFASSAEMQSALELIPGPKMLLEIEGAGHDLLSGKNSAHLPARILEAFLACVHAP